MIGKGGWSWYTGSSAWLFIAGFENILGIKKEGEKLCINPCVPKEWESYSVTYNYKSSVYNINVYNPDHKEVGIKTIYSDNSAISTNEINLLDDEKEHRIDVIM